MKPIKLTKDQWRLIEQRLLEEYSLATVVIRSVMARELGFTTRIHKVWAPAQGYDGYGEYMEEIHLDFVDHHKELFFRLKYL
jgi:hypothetical protein